MGFDSPSLFTSWKGTNHALGASLLMLKTAWFSQSGGSPSPETGPDLTPARQKIQIAVAKNILPKDRSSFIIVVLDFSISDLPNKGKNENQKLHTKK